MKAPVMNEKEMEYSQALIVAINAIREVVPKSMEAEYDVAIGDYGSSHTEDLASMLSNLRKLHQDVHTYKEPKEDE